MRVSHHEVYNELEDILFNEGYAAEIGIDVTADQFEGISSLVLIQAPDLWHHKLEGIARRKAGYKNCTDSAVKD